MKTFNLTTTEKNVLNKIINNPGMSRASLALYFDLNKSTTSYITKKLESLNYIEFYKGINEDGRRGSYIRVNKHYTKLLFVEFSKCKFNFYITNLIGEIISRKVIRITNNYKQLEFLEQELSKISIDYPEISDCLMAIHGTVNKLSNEIQSPFYKVSINEMIEIFKKFNLELHVENEANVYALGLQKDYYANEIDIKIRDGVGCGIIINSKLYSGTHGLAGELGHNIINYKANSKTDMSIEKIISDSATLEACTKLVNSYVSYDNIFDYYSSNEQIKRYIDQNITYIAVLCSNICALFNPQVLSLTSQLYIQFPQLKTDIEKFINIEQIEIPEIHVYEYSEETFLKGFLKLYLELKTS